MEGVDRGAVVRVDEQALALADLRDDRVARDRAAARRELNREALGAPDADRVELVRLAVGPGVHREQLLGHHHREALAQTDVGEDLLVPSRRRP